MLKRLHQNFLALEVILAEIIIYRACHVNAFDSGCYLEVFGPVGSCNILGPKFFSVETSGYEVEIYGAVTVTIIAIVVAYDVDSFRS